MCVRACACVVSLAPITLYQQCSDSTAVSLRAKKKNGATTDAIILCKSQTTFQHIAQNWLEKKDEKICSSFMLLQWVQSWSEALVLVI